MVYYTYDNRDNAISTSEIHNDTLTMQRNFISFGGYWKKYSLEN